jgi:hypothetical protein
VNAYSLKIEVQLHKPLAMEDAGDDEPPIVGYVILMWIRAATVAEAETIAAEAIKDGVINWSGSKTREMPPSEAREQLRGLATPTRGLVRKTGRIYFP